MSTPIIGDDFKAFPGGQLFATGETLEVSAAMGGITMAVADLYRAVEGQEGFDPLLARQACSILVRVNAADGTPVKNLGHDNFRIAMFRSVGDWSNVPVTLAEATEAGVQMVRHTLRLSTCVVWTTPTVLKLAQWARSLAAYCMYSLRCAIEQSAIRSSAPEQKATAAPMTIAIYPVVLVAPN